MSNLPHPFVELFVERLTNKKPLDDFRERPAQKSLDVAYCFAYLIYEARKFHGGALLFVFNSTLSIIRLVSNVKSLHKEFKHR